MHEMTLAVVGLDFANADRSNRRSEALMTLPGEPVTLKPEPRNPHDPHAVAVVSPRGIQIGYIPAERAPLVATRLNRGDEVRAVFQGMHGAVAYIRVRFGGGVPTLPPTRDAAAPTIRADDDAFHADPDGPEWGA